MTASPTAARDTQADVLISGGGLVGQMLALSLAHHGLTSIVVDPANPATVLAPEFDGRASAIASGPWKMMEAIGLGPALQDHGCPIERIWVSDGLKPGELDFAAKPEDGPLGIMFENRRMRLAFTAACAAHDLIDYRAPVTTASIERGPHGVTLALTDGSVLSAPLIAVCEGRRSPTRDAAGITLARWSYGHGAMIGAFAHEAAHENVAYEIFYPEGPFAILPLNDLAGADDDRLQGSRWRHRSAFVWSSHESISPTYLKLGPRGYRAEVLKKMGGILGDIEEIAPRGLFPLTYQRAGAIVADRMVLVGDSAHGIHPIAGQGFNLGLRDVATLVEVLVDGARLGLDLGDAHLLERYGRWRGLDNLSVAAATDGLVHLFGIPGKAASAVRRLGLAGVQRADLLKSFFMAEARGETGDVPKLLAGVEI
ncbi:MAG: FAD-dependent monooxygenase [Sphingopyxis sp.]